MRRSAWAGAAIRPTAQVAIVLDDTAEGERIFKALSDQGTVTMPFEKTFWAERFGMCTDRFGTPWMINAGMPQEATAR